MVPIKARVQNGRLRVDEETDLPEGTEVELVLADWWDDLDDEERHQLEESLERSNRDVQAGDLIPADVVFDRLRRQS